MIIVFFGPPGAGKGTVAELLAEQTGFAHISTGDLFRTAIKHETELGKQVQAITEQGELVPDEITIALVRERLEQPDTETGVFLDGFPRTIAQAEALQSIAAVDHVVNLQAEDALIVRRLSGRRICRACGHIHHIEFRPPETEGVCDKCGGELYQRKDDEVEAIEHRLEVYREQTAALVDFYRNSGLIRDIDGSGRAEDVCDAVRQTLGLSV